MKNKLKIAYNRVFSTNILDPGLLLELKQATYNKLKNKISGFRQDYRLVHELHDTCYWDYVAIYKHLHYTFTEMEREWDRMKAIGWEHTKHDEDKKIITICRILCDRLIKNEYTTKFTARNEAQFKRITEECGNFWDEGYIREDPLNEPNWCTLDHIAEELAIKQDRDLLFKLLSKNIERMWV